MMRSTYSRFATQLNSGAMCMKRLLAILLLFLAGQASAATLDRDGMIGVWVSSAPPGFSDAGLPNKQPRDSLEINGDLTVKLTRRFGAGKEQVLSASPAAVSFYQDLIIVEFPLGTGKAKLVLSGWSSSHTKRLFGNLYLYDGNGMFNGIPASFEPAPGS